MRRHVIWQRGAVVVVLAFGLVACGGGDIGTDAAIDVAGNDTGSAERSTSSTADASTGLGGDQPDDEADHVDHDDQDDDEGGSSTGLGAHEHGAAELSVAWSEAEVVVDLVSPTYNIFGFEREPSTDEERAIVEDRIGALSGPGVIVFNDEAGCESTDEVASDVEFEGSHAELTASWLFRCEAPDEIRELDVGGLFAEYPNLEDVDAQWASPSGQSAAELSPTEHVLGLG